MRIAVKWDEAIVDSDGHVAGHEAGDTLVRRILRIFPNSILVGAGLRRCEGFDVVPLEFLDPADTVVINMDVIDSPRVWVKMYEEGGPEPKIMNFLWWPTQRITSEVGISLMALSCAVFPTFANSERTATEVRELVEKWTVQHLSQRSKLGWVNLGFRLAHVKERVETELPIVLYPAIYLSSRKRPELFAEVIEWVHKQTPIKVEMRLHESHLVSEKAMRFSRKDWIWVGPLTATRTDYWAALARTTVFLATADEESYGIAYVEALGAGVIGIFPDMEWARALVPPNYPYFYRSPAEAEHMLLRAVKEPDRCRAEMDACADGSLSKWIEQHHSDDVFDSSLRSHVAKWFGTISSS
ncbi:MAG: glycosyltransferase family 1 protein [Actinomycetaceae bacterium]|nr:glycosyltransferase family 1 protein [Actinomycetaceae bacterium]